MRTRGVTLMEMLLVLGICLLALGAGILVVHPQAGGGQSAKGLAMVVAEELRLARLGALQNHSPVAVAFPSQNATRPHSQSLYFLQGTSHVGVRHIVDYSSQFPGAYIAVGMWSLTTGGYTINSPSHSSFRVANWLNPVTQDFVVAFAPDGTLQTNDLARVSSGSLNLVVCAGLEFSSATAPSGTPTMGANPPGYFQLQEVDQPYTITVSSAGSISVRPGLTGASSSVVVTGAAHKPSVSPAPKVNPSAFNHPPFLVGVKVYPPSNPTNAGFSTTVDDNGHAEITLGADDPDGDQLTCTWSATGGNFTNGGVQNMTWTPWAVPPQSQATVQWYPPVGAVAGSVYTLTCTVSDGFGGTITTSGTTSVKVGVTQLGRIAFAGNDNQVYIMNGDGTVPQNLSKKRNVVDTAPVLSQDGSKILFVSNRQGTTATSIVTPRIWIMNSDSLGVQNVTGVDTTSAATISATLYGTDTSPTWSPNGSAVAFIRDPDGPGATAPSVQVALLKGTISGANLDSVDAGTSISWGGTAPGKIAYSKAGAIWVMNPDGSSQTNLSAGTTDSNPVWSPDGTRILFLRGSDLWEMKSDGTTQAAKQTGWGPNPIAYRPDGTQIIGIQSNQLMRGDDPGLGNPLANLVNLTPPNLPATPAGDCSWSP